VEGAPGRAEGLGLLPVATRFAAGKVLDRPRGRVVAGPGAGCAAAGYRIHHGRVAPAGDAAPWLAGADGTVLGWHADGVVGTTLHGVFEDDGLRAALLAWAAGRSGVAGVEAGRVSFAAARQARIDAIADALEASLDLPRLAALIAGRH
jgi:adenosylcobyric acid synthase